MERKKSSRLTLFLNYKVENPSKTTFYCPKHLTSIAFYYSQKYYIFYKNFWEKKVL